MTAQGITWVARLVDAGELKDARRLGEALGFTPLIDEPSKLMLQTPRGDVLEYCTPEAPVPDYLFAGHDTVVGFVVTDLSARIADLGAAEFETLSDLVDSEHVRFQHFRGPGGAAYGLIEPKIN